jgi:hypothetical protein
LANVSLDKSGGFKNVVVVKQEKEVWTDFIRLVKLFDFKKMEVVLYTFIVGEALEHIEEEVNWHEAISKSGLLAVVVCLHSNHALLLVKDDI